LGRAESLENLALFDKISLMKLSKLLSENERLSLPDKPFAWNTTATEGYPTPATLSLSSTSM